MIRGRDEPKGKIIENNAPTESNIVGRSAKAPVTIDLADDTDNKDDNNKGGIANKNKQSVDANHSKQSRKSAPTKICNANLSGSTSTFSKQSVKSHHQNPIRKDLNQKISACSGSDNKSKQSVLIYSSKQKKRLPIPISTPKMGPAPVQNDSQSKILVQRLRSPISTAKRGHDPVQINSERKLMRKVSENFNDLMSPISHHSKKCSSENDSTSSKENHNECVVKDNNQQNKEVSRNTPSAKDHITVPENKRKSQASLCKDKSTGSRKRAALTTATSSNTCKSKSTQIFSDGLGTNELPIDLADSSDDDLEANGNTVDDVRTENVTSGMLLETTVAINEKPLFLSKHLENFTKCCWNCSEPLRQSPPTSFNDDDNEPYLCYAMHSHPVLEYPLCAFCCHQTEQVELESDSLYCSGCGTHEADQDGAILVYCDSDQCKRHFCMTCLIKVYGGGEEGERIARQHIGDTKELWRCPICDFPNQHQLKLLGKAIHSIAQQDTSRKVEIVLADLEKAEYEKRLCLERMDKIHEETEEIRNELSQTFSGKELETEVENEMMNLQELYRKDEFNTSDLVNTLQEELQNDHKISLESVYKHLESVYKQEQILLAGDSDNAICELDSNVVEKEPDYVLSANIELAELYKLLKKQYQQDPDSVKRVFPANIYLEEPYENVEDLCNNFVGDMKITEGGWTGQIRPKIEEIEKALRMENEDLAKREIPIKISVDEEQDEEECTREERVVSGRSDACEIGSVYARSEFRVRRKSTNIGSYNLNGVSVVDDRKMTRSSSFVLCSKRKFNPESNTATLELQSNHATSNELESTKQQAYRANLTTASKSSNNFPESMDTHSLSFSDYLFESSELSLCDNCRLDGGNGMRSVKIATLLSSQLKSFQVMGIKFIWDNCFSDFETKIDGDESLVGGCILAHHMGCGKSLTTIALLHSLLQHPSLVNHDKKRLIQRILLVVPVNPLASWIVEFDKWLVDIKPIRIYNLMCQNGRGGFVKKWERDGGVLLVSDSLLVREKNKDQYLYNCLIKHTQVLVVDEAHSMLKNRNTKIFEALSGIPTRRKIALTGSPFQNDLLEYYNLVKFVRQDALNMNETEFELEFKKDIELGMIKDASAHVRYKSLLKSKELFQTFSPFVHRVDGAELCKGLPMLQEAVIYLKQSRFQSNISNLCNRMSKQNCIKKNFFRRYTGLRPIFNHPGAVILQKNSGDDPPEQLDGDDEPIPVNDFYEELGFNDLVNKTGGDDEVLRVDHGFKIVVLLHILAFSQRLNEKVLVFSHCLKTLSYIEYVLQNDDWKDIAPSLRDEFADMKLGGWKASSDYFRIDGQTKSADRGDRIDLFNANEGDDNVRAFLLSSRAGSLGINLQTATRVVIIDEHFNPTYTMQAVCRAYRLGQTKPVFCYLLLVEGTMEEKVFSRGVNKIGIGLQVIDQKTIMQNFSAREVEDLSKVDTWVQCLKCEKWRMLGENDKGDDLPDIWDCSMNVSDPENSTCEAEAKSTEWYMNRLFGPKVTEAVTESVREPSEASDDEILKHLRTINDPAGKKGEVVSKVTFKDLLLVSRSDDEELEIARNAFEQDGASDELPSHSLSSDGTQSTDSDKGNNGTTDKSFESECAPPPTKLNMLPVTEQQAERDKIASPCTTTPLKFFSEISLRKKKTVARKSSLPFQKQPQVQDTNNVATISNEQHMFEEGGISSGQEVHAERPKSQSPSSVKKEKSSKLVISREVDIIDLCDDDDSNH